MTEPPRLPQAFDAVADVAAQANALKPSQARSTSISEFIVEHETDRAEVRVTVQNAQIVSLRLDNQWLEESTTEDVEDTIRACINQAWTSWNEQSLEHLRNATPEISEISAALERARGTIRQAFDNELDRITKEY